MTNSIRNILLKANLWFTAPLLSVLLLMQTSGASAQGLSSVVLWDTGTHFSDTVNPADRRSWKAVPTDLLSFEANPPKASSDPGYYGREYAFRGDAVVENQGMLAVLWAAKGTLVLYAKPSSAGSAKADGSGSAGLEKILELSPAQVGTGSAPAAADLVLMRNADDEVAVQLVFQGASNLTLMVGFDRTQILSVNSSAGLEHFTIRAPFEYAIVPSFLGDDLIFGVQDKSGRGVVSLPSENMLLGLLKGETTEFVVTWPKGKQHLGLGLGKDSNGRQRIESLDFDNGGQSFYVAPLAYANIWHKEALTVSYLEKDQPIAWKKPFAARWKTQLYEQSVKTTFAFRPTKGEVWRGVAGSYEYPVWFEGDQAYYHLSKKVPPKGESLIYFLEGQGTPLSITTPADILKTTLGRPMADSLLDLAGRKLRTHHRRGGEGVHRACTCGCTEAIQAVFEAHEEVDRKEEIKGDLEDMVYFVHAHVNRINEYRRVSEDLIREMESRKASSPELGEYIDDLEQVVRQIPQECSAEQENMKSFAYADELVGRTLALTEKMDGNNLKAYMDLLKEWRAMGGSQDSVLAHCHIIFRQLAQEAGYGCASQPKAVALAEELRARVRECLRNPDGYEIWADY